MDNDPTDLTPTRSRFATWVNQAPEGTSLNEKRAYGLARVGFPLGLFSHFSFIFLFWYLDQPVMALFNIGSSIIVFWGTWAAWTLRDIRSVTLLTMLGEIPLHAICATYFMGIEPFFIAFQLFPVMLLPLLSYYDRRTRLMLSFASAAVFVVIGTMALVSEPVRPLTGAWNIFFFMFNAIPVIGFIGLFASIYETAATTAEENLESEFERAEGLLLNILPEPIATRLKENPELIADEHPQVSVLFADIVGFTETSERMAPADLVRLLNTAFSRFDALVEKHGCEKIKTIGDAYMVVAGLPEPRADHAKAMIALALDMIDVAEEINASGDFPFSLRIGVNSGPVVAGVIGDRKFAYDLWGDTVNVAARMESHGRPGLIQISEATRKELGDAVNVDPLGHIDVKGKGSMATYAINPEK